MMKKLILIPLGVILFWSILNSQVDLSNSVHVKDPLWNLNTVSGNKEFDKDPFFQVSENPGWMHVSSSGYLVFSGGGKIKGIEPNEGVLAWNTKYTDDLPRIYTGSFEEIPNTPYFAVVDRKGKRGQFIISTIDGKIAANTGEEGLVDINERFILPEAGRILFMGKDVNKTLLASYDMNNPSHKWASKEIFGWHLPVTAPLELNDHEFVIATLYNIYKINSNTGEVIWKVKPAKGAAKTMSWSNAAQDAQIPQPSRFFRMEGEDFFYYQTESGIMVYDMETGKAKWDKSARATQESLVVFDPKGMIVFAEKVFMFDYKTGEKIWDKPVKSKGAVNFYAYTPQGLVVGIQKLNIRKVPYFELNCIDPDEGVFKFEKNFRINGNLLELLSCDAGVLYTTDRELNIWDAESGKTTMASIEVSATGNFFDIKNWDYTAPPNGRLLGGFAGEMAYVLNTETNHLYSINTSKGTKQQLTRDPIDFEDKQTATSLEVRDKGIFIASSQTAILLDFDGNEIYKVNFPKAKKGFLWKMTAAAATVYDQQRRANHAIRQSRPNLSNNSPRLRSEHIRKIYGVPEVRIEVNVGAAKKILNDRFEASKMRDDAYYIFTQLKNRSGGWLDGEYGLVKINKDNGVLEKYISFGKNLEPNFVIDEITGRLFYASGNRILCFDMN